MAVEGDFSEEDLSKVVPLLGERAEPIHMPVGAAEGIGGGDVDCLVWELDPVWPLRLPSDWRLLQILQYDSVAWYWVLERGGQVLALDTLADPWGIGQYAWPVTESSFPLQPGTRAGYLTTKRLRKGIRSEQEWDRIKNLAQEDPGNFEHSLTTGSMGKLGAKVAHEVLSAGRPDAVWDEARRMVKKRRIQNPRRALRVVGRQAVRGVGRWLRPTGLAVTLVGPDGTGKSTLSAAILETCEPMFRRTSSQHWRPGVLPRSRDFTGQERDASDPHATTARNAVTSVLVASYHWLDFLVGGWTKDRFRRARSTLIVAERGWEDLAVDPLRYRLAIPPSLVRAAARLLPKPDVAFVLSATGEVAESRKPELSLAELSRQSAAWRENPPRGRVVIPLDADQTLEEVIRSAREHIIAILNQRAMARLGSGWVALPMSKAPRWWIPRSSARVAKNGLAIYQPVTKRGLWGWRLARAIGGFRGLSMVPKSRAVPEEVRAALADHLPKGGTFSLLRANHPGRYVALLMERSGMPHSVAKIALNDGREALRREAETLKSTGSLLLPPLSAPRVLESAPGLLVVKAVEWRPRSDPWRLDPTVARSLGEWFSALGGTKDRGPNHGDFAPWNLLRTADGWVLVDWEEATSSGRAFDDIFHYFVQAHALLGKPSMETLFLGLTGKGEFGLALTSFSQGAGLTVDDLQDRFRVYLESSMVALKPDQADRRAGIKARRDLLEQMH